jgi:hypothetical protein
MYEPAALRFFLKGRGGYGERRFVCGGHTPDAPAPVTQEPTSHERYSAGGGEVLHLLFYTLDRAAGGARRMSVFMRKLGSHPTREE